MIPIERGFLKLGHISWSSYASMAQGILSPYHAAAHVGVHSERKLLRAKQGYFDVPTATRSFVVYTAAWIGMKLCHFIVFW